MFQLLERPNSFADLWTQFTVWLLGGRCDKDWDLIICIQCLLDLWQKWSVTQQPWPEAAAKSVSYNSIKYLMLLLKSVVTVQFTLIFLITVL